MIFNSLALALDYLTRYPNRYLFPIKAAAKYPPLVKDNLAGNASNDPEQIKKWVKQFTRRDGVGPNWGVALKKSSLFVVDVDCNAAKGKQGQTTFDDLDLLYGFPDTEKVVTPSGGFHLYYDGEHVFKLGKYGLGQDIDSPNYVLIEGCTFKDGTSYKRVNPETPTAPKPSWFAEVIRAAAKERVTNASEAAVDLDKPAAIAWARDYLKNDAEPAIQGQGGENATFRVACSLRDNGISQGTAFELMNELYNVPGSCDPEWEPEELRAKIGNAYTYASLAMAGGKTAEAEFMSDDVKAIADSIPTTETKPKKREKAKGPWDTDCAVIVNPASFVDIKSKRMLSNKSFNNRYGASGGAEAHKKAIKSKAIARFDGVCYRPGADQSAMIDGRSHFNTYRAPTVQPLGEKPELFLSHMEYLIEDEPSREHLLDCLAWMIQHPDRKMIFAILLLGEPRTGKSVIGLLMRVLLGAMNCSEPSRKQVASEFNGWLSSKQLVIIHELREKGTAGLYDTLKELITQPTVKINLKGIEAFDIENTANFLTISNHEDALPLDDRDGRYLVIRCADEPRYGWRTPQSEEYYGRLFEGVGTPDAPGDEARRVLHFLQNREIKLNCTSLAPETEAKAEMVEASRSNLEKFLRNALEAKLPPLACPIINSNDVVSALSSDIEAYARNQRSVEAALREIGARPLSKLGQINTASGKRRLWALDGRRVSDFLKLGRTEVAAIYDEGQKRTRLDAETESAADDFGVADAPLVPEQPAAEPALREPWD